MKFVGSIMLVENIERSREFYEKTLKQNVLYDFGVNISFEGPFAIHLKSHFVEIAKIKEPSSILLGSNSFDLCFETDEIDETYHELKAMKAQFLHAIEEQPWGQRVIRVYDPDKHIVEIGETMEAVVNRFYKHGFTVDEIINKTGMPKEFVERAIKV